MSSILTNNSSMVALNTLRNINKQLGDVQGNISTGKKIANARDNAAVWSVAAVMNSDVTGFKAITDSLSLGQSTLNVARTGAETVNKLLDELKGRIVAAQADNVDRTKIQADANELRNNINATVEASQFNGLNLLKGDTSDPDVEIVGSLDRDSAGNVTVANIDVARASLEDGTIGALTTLAKGADNTAATNIAGTNIQAASAYNNGDKIAISLVEENGNGIMLTYTVSDADRNGGVDDQGAALTADATAAQLKSKVMAAFATQLNAMDNRINGTAIADVAGGADDAARQAFIDTAVGNLFTDITDFDMEIISATATAQIAGADGSTTALNSDVFARGAQGGGLAELGLIDVSTKGGAMAALDAIEEMTQSSIEAAAAFGSSGKRVDIQMDFLKDLTDSLTAGIGSLVDADMEETSARLQALQVQQQLGVQALSIANQQPQTLLSLFR